MIIDKEYSKKLALDLLNINAVVLRPDRPFVWSSGWRSPIYCDNRLTLNYPEIRKSIANQFTGFIKKHYPKVDVLTGTATAGIPHAAWVADRLDLPMAYVRNKTKSYGMGNQIEGGVKRGQSTLIIEDLISTGTSVISVANVIEFISAEVNGILSIFTYGFDQAHAKIEEAGYTLYTLTDYSTLINVAVENNYIDENQLQTLNEWRQKPDTWPK